MGLFGRREKTNSEIANDIHQQGTNQAPPGPEPERVDEKEEDEEKPDWHPSETYVGWDCDHNDDSWYRCQTCRLTISTDDFNTWGEFWNFTELHAIRHLLAKSTAVSNS